MQSGILNQLPKQIKKQFLRIKDVKTKSVKFWLLRTLWHNLHMFLDILEFKIEDKKVVQEKLFLKTWSQICGKMTYLFTKPLLEKVQKKNPECVNNIWQILWT